MEKTEVTSQKYSLNWKDVSKALVIAVGTDVLFVIQQSLSAGSLNIDWKNVGAVAVAAVVTYLTRNFFRTSKTVTPNQ